MATIKYQPGIAKLLFHLLLLLCAVQIALAAEIVLGRPPQLKEFPTNIFIGDGEAKPLDCKIENADQFSWYQNDELLGIKSKIISISYDRESSGQYRCVGSNAIGTVISPIMNVIMKYLDDFDEQSVLHRYVVAEGNSVLMKRPKLEASALLDVRYSWYKGQNEVSRNTTHYVTNDGDLIILSVDGTSLGEYRVIATSDAQGEVMSNGISLELATDGAKNSEFSILSAPKDVFLDKDNMSSPLVFDCVSSYMNDVTTHWFLNGEPLSSQPGVQLSAGNRRLELKNPSSLSILKKGANSLDCKASAQSGRRFKNHRSVINVFDSNAVSEEEVPFPFGSSPSITCSDDKTQSFRWFFNGKKVRNTGSILQLQNIYDGNYGVYQCEPQSNTNEIRVFWLKEGENIAVEKSEPAEEANPGRRMMFMRDPTNRQVERSVAHDEDQNPSDANDTDVSENESAEDHLIESPPVNQSMLIGTSLEIPCTVVSKYRNKAKTSWYIDGLEIPPQGNAGLRVSRNRKGGLVIGQVGPDSIGEYKCTITVGEREESASMWLKIIEKPNMPEGVRAILINDTVPAKIRVNWNEGFNGNSPIIRYQIHMRTIGPTDLWSDWEVVGEMEPSETELCCSYVLDNLRPSVTAEFRVVASNKHGLGKASLPSANVTMPQQPPAAAPRNVAASARSSNSIIVQWQKPQDEQFSGDILGYVIRYRLAGYTALSWIEKNVTTRDARNAIIDQLLTWQEYEIQVSAYNERGMGVFSKSIDVTTSEGVPTLAPKNVAVKVLSSTTVQVSFDAPDQQRIPGVNLGYKVQFWQGVPETGHLYKQANIDPAGRNLKMVVDGLEKFGHYNVTVLCHTSPGDGPKSSPIEIITEEDTPGPVADLTIQEVMYDGAFVTWEHPRSPNGVINKYQMRYWNDKSPEAKTSVDMDGNQRNVTINGLQSSTKYSLDIVAFTKIGEGPREETKFESGRPPILPERPTSLSVSDIQARSVRLHFNPGHDGYTAIRQWIVEARIADSGVFHTVFNTSSPKAHDLLVTGLRPFTRYELRLIPENVKGRGAPSEPTRPFETKQTNPDTPAASIFAEPTSATAITVSWTPLLANQWNGQPKGYLVLYRVAGEENWKEVRTPLLRASEITLSNLRPYSNYEVDLYAENMFAKSASAGISTTKTYESVPAAAPRDIRSVKDGLRTIRIEWDTVNEDSTNGEVLGYKVRVAPRTDGFRQDDNHIIDVPGADILKTKVSGLRSYTAYQVFVSAYTIVGIGPENSLPVVVETEEGLPEAPAGVSFSFVAEDEVRLKWLPPDNPNGKIKGYLVKYWKSDEGPSAAHTVPITSSALTVFPAKLSARNAKYTFTVAAETSVGTGAEAQVDVVTTSIRVPMVNPGTPTRDERVKYSYSHVAIRWDHSPSNEIESDEAPVRFVKVAYQKANENEWTNFARNIAGDKGGVTVIGLSANTPYRFRIRNVGDFLESSWSAESEWMRTLPSAPNKAPLAITSTPYSSSSLLLHFTVPPKTFWNADSIGFRISYREYPSNDSWKTEDIPLSSDIKDDWTYVLPKLASFRHYIVRMSSFNSEGESEYSAPVFAYVGYSIPKRKVNNLIAEPKSSSSIAVRWDPWLPDESDVISGFKVRFVPVTSVLSESSHDAEIMVVENNSCIITDLRKYTNYQISVSAYNRAGEGTMSELRVSTLEDVPGSVSNLRFTDVLLDSVKVVWDPPKQPNGNITLYTVNYRTFKMPKDYKKEIQSVTDQLFFPATGLEEGGVYVFTVWAETSAGKGTEATANVTIGPNSVGPPAPTRPSVVPGQSSVSILWKDSASAEITGHLIQAKRLSSVQPPVSPGEPAVERVRRNVPYRPSHVLGQWVTLKTVEGASQRHEISYRELEPSSIYVFRVYARNERGVGFASSESDQLQVPASIPEDPFYTTWWFIALVAMTTFVIIVVVVAFLCVTGSEARFKRSKRNSNDSLQLADGNFVTFQMKGNRGNVDRSRNDIFTPRPGTTQSWLSDRDPPAYGSVLAVDREVPAGGPSIVNMYGQLATDVVPQAPNQQAMQRLSALVGRDITSNGTAYVSGSSRRGSGPDEDYGNRSEYGATRSDYGAYGARSVRDAPSVHAQSLRNEPQYEMDSFDEDDGSVTEGEDTPYGDRINGHDIANHYAHSENYSNTWRRVRDMDAVRAAPPPPASVGGKVPSPAGSSESNWNGAHSTSTTATGGAPPPLANGFGSFV